MQTAAKSLLPPQPLTAISGYLNKKETINKITETAWVIALSALWNGEIFSTAEKTKAKEYIRLWIIDQPCLHTAYLQLTQRILLARQYVSATPGRYIPSPTEWFNPDFPHGFVGTATWFYKLQKRREAMPLHNLNLKAFAEAIEEMVDDPSPKNFHYWREYFIERNCQGLLNLFLATMANLNYTVN